MLQTVSTYLSSLNVRDRFSLKSKFRAGKSGKKDSCTYSVKLTVTLNLKLSNI